MLIVRPQLCPTLESLVAICGGLVVVEQYPGDVCAKATLHEESRRFVGQGYMAVPPIH